MSLIKNIFLHFRTITKHRREVFKLCCIAGIPFRGLVHDLSKYSPTEFIESARYFQGNRSPIMACKEANGYSMAWLHHKGHNKHHPEYWVDKLYLGGVPIRIPYVYNMEMVCDIIAASKVYNGNSFTYRKPYEFWDNRMERTSVLHDKTRKFTAIILRAYAEKGNAALKKKHTKNLYEKLSKEEEI